MVTTEYATDNRDMTETVICPADGSTPISVDPTDLYINALQNCSATDEMDLFAERVVGALNNYFGEVLEHEDGVNVLSIEDRMKDFVTYLQNVGGQQ